MKEEKEIDKIVNELFRHNPKPMGSPKEHAKLAKKVYKILVEEGKYDQYDLP